MNINTLYHGDCLDIMKLIKDQTIDFIMCDLPYGTTACSWDSIIPLNLLWSQYFRIIKKGGAIALTATQPFTSVLVSSNLNMFKYSWVWHKNRATAYVAAKYRPLSNHEDILIFAKNKTKYHPQKTIGHSPTNSAKGCKQGEIYQGNGIWDYKGGSTDRYPLTIQKFNCERGLHPTQKPIALFEYLIKTYTDVGDLVLDNCIGSGTTAIASLRTSRNYIGIEKEYKYVEIAQKRIDKYLLTM